MISIYGLIVDCIISINIFSFFYLSDKTIIVVTKQFQPKEKPASWKHGKHNYLARL